MEQEIKKVWEALSDGLDVKLFDSMNSRLENLIKANSDYTSYQKINLCHTLMY